METINSRIAFLISKLSIKKGDFAEKVGITPAFVSQICSGARQPSDRTISDICREYKVSETWLRTGEGEMLRQQTRYEQIASFFGDLMNSEPDVRHRFISAIEKTDIETLKMIEQAALRLVEEMQKTDP